MKQLGTILPTIRSVESTANYAKRQTVGKRETARRLNLDSLPQTTSGLEKRYWKSSSIYAVIGRDMLPKWFVVCTDGDYSITQKA